MHTVRVRAVTPRQRVIGKAKGLNTDYITAMWYILCMYRRLVITDTHVHSIQGATSGDRRPSGATSLTAVKEYIP